MTIKRCPAPSDGGKQNIQSEVLRVLARRKYDGEEEV
jgi:hypothetical protein